jgi:soluble lytic murein transglycosylase
MRRWVAVLTLSFFLSLKVFSIQASEVISFDHALRVAEQLKNNQLSAAYKQAESSHFLTQIVNWYQALNPNENTPFSIYGPLLQNHGHDWPRHARIERKAEDYLIKKNPSPSTILKWFDHHHPKTYKGCMLYIDALLSHKNHLKAHEVIRGYFKPDKMNQEDEKNFITKYRKIITRQDIFNYLKKLLHKKEYARANLLKNHLYKEDQLAFETMLAFYQLNEKQISTLLPKLQKSYFQDADFIEAKLHYDKKKDNLETILHFLKTHKVTPKTQKTYINARKYAIRELIKEKKYTESLKLAQHHGLMPSVDKADLDWTAGWLYLRFLNRPQEAYLKFTHLYNEVSSSISKSRAAYWSGRAALAMKHTKDANLWFKKASQYGATFYGQMAAFQLKTRPQISILTPKMLNQRTQNYLTVASAFERVGFKDQTEMFLRYLMKQPLSTAQQAYLAQEFSVNFGRKDLAAILSREVFRNSSHIIREGYPILNYPLAFKDPALVHAVILQESRFEQNLVGSTNDYGLMQIIPPTAMRLCKKFSVPYSLKRLTDDGPYNVKLGSLYLNELSGIYTNSYPLMAAEYNAGAAARWIKTYGDPRLGQIDMIDWIELIPFSTTRNYVQRVMENIYVYRSLNPHFPKTKTLPITLISDWRVF